MMIQIESVGFDPSVTLNELIEKRLKNYFAKFDFVHTTKVFLRLQANDKTHQHQMEVVIHTPKKDLVAKCAEDRFEKALDECIDKLKPQIQKVKEKLKEH